MRNPIRSSILAGLATLAIAPVFHALRPLGRREAPRHRTE